MGCTVDLLQMDVQGFEVGVLKGASQTLKRHSVKNFLIGTHNEELHSNCISILKQHGYYICVNRYETIDQPNGILSAGLEK